MTDQGQSLWGASFSHVSRTNVISPSLEADFQDLFSDASRGGVFTKTDCDECSVKSHTPCSLFTQMYL
eukprot:m.199065 g.199065  ORF g.199065 m.199065 type:complete len:68 (-) comp15309_c0_seq5:3072-3275(-)